MSRYEVVDFKGNPSDAGGMVVTMKDKESEQKRLDEERKRKAENIIVFTFILCAFFLVLFVWGVISLVGTENPKNDTKNYPQREISSVVEIEPEPQPMPQIEVIENAELLPEVEYEADFYNPAVPLSYEKQEMLYKAAEEFDVPYNLALSVVWKETNFKNVQGDNGRAYGYFQIWKKWHGDRMAKLGVSDLMDTDGNFRVGCSILGDLLKQYDNTHKALMVYNMGAGGASKAWTEGYSSSGYSRAVLDYMARLS